MNGIYNYLGYYLTFGYYPLYAALLTFMDYLLVFGITQILFINEETAYTYNSRDFYIIVFIFFNIPCKFKSNFLPSVL